MVLSSINSPIEPFLSSTCSLWPFSLGSIRGGGGMSSQFKRGTKKVVTHASMVVQTGEREASLNAKYWIDENTNICSIEVCIIGQHLWRRSTVHVWNDLKVYNFFQLILGVEQDLAILQEFLIPGVLWGYLECIHFPEITNSRSSWNEPVSWFRFRSTPSWKLSLSTSAFQLIWKCGS